MNKFLMSLLLASQLPAAAPATVSPETTAPPRLIRPAAAGHVVTGTVTQEKLAVRVKLFADDGKLLEQHDVFPDAAERSFIVGFKTPLEAGSILTAHHLLGAKELTASAPVTVTAGSSPSPATPAVEAPAAPAPAKPPAAATVKPPAAAPAKPEPCAVASIDGLGTPGVRAQSGATKLTGPAVLAAGRVTVCVNRVLQAIAAPVPPPALPTAFATDGVPFSNGHYEVVLKDRLLPNQEVLVIVTSSDGKRLSGTDIAEVAEVVGVPVQLPESLRQGQDTVSAIATPTPAGANYEIRLQPCAETGLALKTSDAKPYVVTTANGNANLIFDTPFVESQEVKICQVAIDKGSGEPLTLLELTGTPAVKVPVLAAALSSPPITVTDPGDLGRFRYYFTSGLVLSNSRGFATQSSGTQAGTFLGLTADRSWFPGDKDGWKRWNVNTFFDARLTQVATQQSSGNAMGSGSSGSTPLQSYSQSAKAASLQAGVYVPLLSRAWVRGPKENYSLFLGPLAKTGFVTLTDSIAVADATNASASQQVSGRFFTNHSYGTRLGVFRHRPSKDSAPELIHWVDITLGKFGGFEAFRDARRQQPNLYPPADLSMSSPQFITQRAWRWQFEGLLKVPHTPFVLGFNANVGRGAVKAFADANKALFHFAQPRDDLRFLFGAQFDFAKLMRLLPSLQ